MTVTVTLIFSAVFYRYYIREMKADIVSTQLESVKALSGQIDNLIHRAEIESLLVTENAKLRRLFLDAAVEGRRTLTEQETVDYETEIQEIFGVGYPYYRISVYGNGGPYLGSGYYYDPELARRQVSALPWFEKLKDYTAVNRLVLPPHRDEWSSSGNRVVSVIRRLQDGPFVFALAEMQIPEEALERIILDQLEARPDWTDASVFLIGTDGSPLQSIRPDRQPLSESDRQRLIGLGSREDGYLRAGNEGRQSMLFYGHSELADWSVVAKVPERALFGQLRYTIGLTVGFAAMLGLLSLGAVYLFARKATLPVRKLRRMMDHIDSHYTPRSHGGFGKHDELQLIGESFRGMLRRLEEHKEASVLAYSRELQARYNALQAQINPHFLHNTLNLIGMMAWEGNAETVSTMCAQLSEMFRYVTYSDEEMVELGTEMNYARNYLAIMETRFGDHLKVEMEVPADARTLRVPKLIVQPFIENAVKHGFNQTPPPWHISVRCGIEDNRWFIWITDNGSGFSESAAAEIGRQMEQVRSQAMRSGARMNIEASASVGIANCYARLLMKNGSGTTLTIENRPPHGSAVIISGTREEKIYDYGTVGGRRDDLSPRFPA